MTTAFYVMAGRGRLLVILAHGVVYSACLGGLAGLLLPPVIHRVRGRGLIVEWLVTLLALLVVAVVGTFLACAVLGGLGLSFGQPLATRFVASLGVNALLTAAIGVAVTIYESQRERLNAVTLELRTRELERERERKTALEARLSSLESRLHPHFLFNTLNAITELIHENPDRAERTVERLAALLRASLDATGRGLVPLSRELELVSDYLEIEKTRFAERLNFSVEAGTDCQDAAVPRLALQTLVENSVKHAVAPRPGGGSIRIRARREGGQLCLEVADDGPGFAAQAMEPGHGLDNLRQRLETLFAGRARLEIAADSAAVRIILPAS